MKLTYTTFELEAALRAHVCMHAVYVCACMHACPRARARACVGPSPLRSFAPDKVDSSGAAVVREVYRESLQRSMERVLGSASRI